jgi:hypothetical protein
MSDGWSELLLLMTAYELRQGNGDHQGAAIEHLLDKRAETQKDETCNPSDQEINGDGRAPRVETSGAMQVDPRKAEARAGS